MVSIYVNMSCVMLAMSIFLLSARYDLPDFYHEGHDILLNYEDNAMLLRLALFCLVTGFILLYWTSYLRNGRTSVSQNTSSCEMFQRRLYVYSIIINKTLLWLKGLGINTF